MRNRYLIDYENVANAGLYGVEDLTEDDEVIIFYSSNVNTMTFDTHYKLMETKANVIVKSVGIGTKNALDFQLSTLLGYLIARDRQKRWSFHIVSHDTGFDHVLRFWHEQDIDVDRRISIGGDVLPLKEPKDPVAADAESPKLEPATSPAFKKQTREQFIEEMVKAALTDDQKANSRIVAHALMGHVDRKAFNSYLTKHGVQNATKIVSSLGEFFVGDKIKLAKVNKMYDDQQNT